MAMGTLGDPRLLSKDPCVDDVPYLPDDLLPLICKHSTVTCRLLSKAWLSAFDTYVRKHGVRIACVGVRHRQPYMRPSQAKLDVTLTLRSHELVNEPVLRGSKYVLQRSTSLLVHIANRDSRTSGKFFFNANSTECPGRAQDFDAFHLKSSKVSLQSEDAPELHLERYGYYLRIIVRNTTIAQRGYGQLFEYYMLAEKDKVNGQEDYSHAHSMSRLVKGALRFMEMVSCK